MTSTTIVRQNLEAENGSIEGALPVPRTANSQTENKTTGASDLDSQFRDVYAGLADDNGHECGDYCPRCFPEIP